MSYGDTPPPGGYSSGTPVNGTLILVLGILGLLICQILSPIAWIMGNTAIRTPGAAPDQVNLANIGRILGIIGTVFLILGVIWSLTIGSTMISAILHGAANGGGAPGAPTPFPS